MGVLFNFQPHATQRIVAADRHIRFRTVCCGRRWGKTRIAAAELLDIAGLCGGLYAWIAPSYYIAERGQRALTEIAGEFIKFSGQNPVRARFIGGAGPVEILFLTADHPETILGEGYDGVVVDEAARIEANVWQQYIRPSLADKLGWGIMISTPVGRNWFYDFHQRGQDPLETQYRSYTFKSTDNPFFLQEEWDEAKRTTPSDLFRQEYEGAFLDNSAGVFRDIDACIVPDFQQRTGDIALGVDLAKHNDFTVLTAMDRRTGAVIDWERFNMLDWPIQKERILAAARKYSALIVLDATGAGDPIYDDLRAVWPRIEPVKFTNATKAHLIQRLIVKIEQHQICWPEKLTVLTDELRRYEYAITAHGAITYNAPDNYHDDAVISLALAASGIYPAGSAGGSMAQLPRARTTELKPQARGLYISRRVI